MGKWFGCCCSGTLKTVTVLQKSAQLVDFFWEIVERRRKKRKWGSSTLHNYAVKQQLAIQRMDPLMNYFYMWVNISGLDGAAGLSPNTCIVGRLLKSYWQLSSLYQFLLSLLSPVLLLLSKTRWSFVVFLGFASESNTPPSLLPPTSSTPKYHINLRHVI